MSLYDPYSNNDKQNSERSPKDRASQLFLENYNFVRFIAFESSPSRQLLEDIVNSVFVTFVQKAESWDLNSDIKPLLRQITRNISLQFWKKHIKNMPDSMRKIAEFLQNQTSNTHSILGSEDLEEETMALELCLKKLTDRSRNLIELYYFENIPLVRIAEQTGRKPLTLGKTVCRIRAKLRSCIERTLKGGAHE